MMNRFPILLVLLGLCGCQGLVIEKHIYRNYYVVAADVVEQASLCYKISGENGYGSYSSHRLCYCV